MVDISASPNPLSSTTNNYYQKKKEQDMTRKVKNSCIS